MWGVRRKSPCFRITYIMSGREFHNIGRYPNVRIRNMKTGPRKSSPRSVKHGAAVVPTSGSTPVTPPSPDTAHKQLSAQLLNFKPVAILVIIVVAVGVLFSSLNQVADFLKWITSESVKKAPSGPAIVWAEAINDSDGRNVDVKLCLTANLTHDGIYYDLAAHLILIPNDEVEFRVFKGDPARGNRIAALGTLEATTLAQKGQKEIKRSVEMRYADKPFYVAGYAKINGKWTQLPVASGGEGIYKFATIAGSNATMSIGGGRVEKIKP